MKALPSNRLVSSPAYGKIIHQYNEMLQADGKVNNKKFFEKYVAPELPNYSMTAWYQFLKRFKTQAGIIAAEIANISGAGGLKNAQSAELTKTMLSNQAATTAFIQSALNIGAARAKQILEHPELMTAKEAMDFALKAMKAQDSRIHAIGKLREDNREQERFDKAFDNNAYEQ
jgi:hypothetical protein